MTEEKEINQLPKDWKWVKLGEVCNIQTGKYDANHAKPRGKYRFYTCAFEFMYCDTNRFKGESLILPGNGANVGEVFYYNGEFDAYQRTYVLNEIKSFPKYLYYHLLGNWKRKNQDKQFGSATNYIRMGNFTDYELPLPPNPIQLAIVSKIEELFSEIENGIKSLFTAKEQLKKYRQSVLKWAFEGKLTNGLNCDLYDLRDEHDLSIAAEAETEYRVERNHNNQKNQKNHSSDKGELPEGWKWVKINYLLSHAKKGMATGPFGTMLKKSEHQTSGVPVLGIENIGEGIFQMPNKIFVSNEKAIELKNFTVKENDIIISRSGTVGEICLLPKRMENSIISTNLIKVSLNLEIINPKYFVYLFQGGKVRQQVFDLCKGSSRAFLNQTILNSLDFPYCSIGEQNKVVEAIESRLSVADKMEESITESLQQAEALKQSILKKAFEGKLK